VIFGAVAERATCKVCWRTGATTPTSCGHIGLHAVRKAKLKIGAIRGNLGIVSQELRAGQVELRLDGTTTITGYDSIVLRAAVLVATFGGIPVPVSMLETGYVNTQ
jgi:hypothetical protein